MPDEGNYSRRSEPRDRQLRVGHAERESSLPYSAASIWPAASTTTSTRGASKAASRRRHTQARRVDRRLAPPRAERAERREAEAGGPGLCRSSTCRSWSRRSSSAKGAPPGFWGRSSVWFVVRPFFWRGFGWRAFGIRGYGRRRCAVRAEHVAASGRGGLRGQSRDRLLALAVPGGGSTCSTR